MEQSLERFHMKYEPSSMGYITGRPPIEYDPSMQFCRVCGKRYITWTKRWDALFDRTTGKRGPDWWQDHIGCPQYDVDFNINHDHWKTRAYHK